MGEVWRARDTKLGREVAIKTLPEEFAQDADRLARFEREAKLLASLNHPNIAAIYGLEEDAGSRFLVLELVEGPTSWSPDGLVLLHVSPQTGIHAWTRENTETTSGTDEVIVAGEESAVAIMPQFSPDGGWFVYMSTETDRSELYAFPYPIGDAARQTVTTDGGVLPLWPREGDELFFLNNQTPFMQAIGIRTQPTLTRDNPTNLFSPSGGGFLIGRSGQSAFDVTADAERLLFSTLEGTTTSEDDTDDFRRINIVVNWFEELNERVPIE